MTGGTGFIGKNLTQALVRGGHTVTILSRSGKGKGKMPEGVSVVKGDPIRKGLWQAEVEKHEIVINLAGASIFTRWNEATKTILRESRILTTRNLIEAIAGGGEKTFFSASAVGYYGFHKDEFLLEESPPGNDFLAQLAWEWEEEARKITKKGCRLVITRFGIVLGDQGGALRQMIPLFRKYLGGPLGSGRQWVSWIHIEDLTRAFLFLMEAPEISGAVNFTAPNPVRNRTLAKALGKAMGRPWFIPAPGFLLKLIKGEFGSVLLKGQRVIPVKLLKGGFKFNYSEIDQALDQIIRGNISGRR